MKNRSKIRLRFLKKLLISKYRLIFQKIISIKKSFKLFNKSPNFIQKIAQFSSKTFDLFKKIAGEQFSPSN